MIIRPSLENSLAYAVLTERNRWLGETTPTNFHAFLDGAEFRARLCRKPVPEWQIWGPLQNPLFDRQALARTGHPTLTIRWPSALEFIHFAMDDACDDLLRMMRQFVKEHPLDTTTMIDCDASLTLLEHLSELALRPGMYLGDNDGWRLRCWLAGMNDGGDWLGLPQLPGLRKTIRAIESLSKAAYGSPFALYRVYDAADLLKRVGIEPVSKENSRAGRVVLDAAMQKSESPFTP